MTNREEVAKKLLEAKEQLEKEGFYGYTIWYRIEPELFEIIYETVCGSKEGDYNEIFTKLADLIDPTCKNKQVEANKMAPIEFKADNFICSNCGETFCADKEGINAPIDWSYCPACGARVVHDA